MKHWKQITLISILAIISIMVIACVAKRSVTQTASGMPANASYFIRTYGDVFGNLDRNDVMELLKMDANPFTDIEMVGWSNRGLFAYRYRYLIDDAMISCWVYSLVVINAVTDEIIEKNTAAIAEFNEDFETMEYVESLSNLLDFKLFFKEERKEVSIEYRNKWNAILEGYNISGRVNNPFSETFRQDLLQFPINSFYGWLEHNISTIMQWQEATNRDWKVDIVSWKLIIGNDRVQKIITERKDEEYRFVDNISGRKILGYYKSPYENRIVAVVSHYRYSPISGGDHRVGLDVFGCNMNVGLNY